MPDFNPDREGHVDHRFIVQNAWPQYNHKKGLQTSKGNLAFNHEDRFVVKDAALAREIQQDNPKDVTVTRVRNPSQADRGHRYHFGQMPAMPWHRYDDDGNRIDNAVGPDQEAPEEESNAEDQ